MAKTSTAKKPSAPKKPVTTKQVVDWVRDRIRVGKFVPGQRLVEADIIKATGCEPSQSPRVRCNVWKRKASSS